MDSNGDPKLLNARESGPATGTCGQVLADGLIRIFGQVATYQQINGPLKSPAGHGVGTGKPSGWRTSSFPTFPAHIYSERKKAPTYSDPGSFQRLLAPRRLRRSATEIHPHGIPDSRVFLGGRLRTSWEQNPKRCPATPRNSLLLRSARPGGDR